MHYVAGPEPQQLKVSFSLIVQDPERYVLSMGEREIVQMINWGLGGGDRFAPGTSSATFLKGDLKPTSKSKGARRHDATLAFEVAGVAPEYLRVIAAHVLRPMKTATAATLHIEGAASGPTAVDGATLSRWQKDTTTYPRRAPGALPFPWREESGGARVTVETREPLTDAMRGLIEDAVTAWQAFLGHLPDEAGNRQDACFRSARAQGKARNRFSIDLIQHDKYFEVVRDQFPYERSLAVMGLQSALWTLHQRHFAIAEATLSLPSEAP